MPPATWTMFAGAGSRREGYQLRPTRRMLAFASAAMVLLFIVGFTAGTVFDPGIGDDETAQLLLGGPGDAGDLL